MADTGNGNGKTERWVKWAIGIALGLVVYVVAITKDYATFKAKTEAQLDSNISAQLDVNRRMVTTLEKMAQQNDSMIRLLELHDRGISSVGRYERPVTPAFPRGQMFDK